jgi:hypothetical protein
MGADTISLSGLEKDVYEQSISEGVNNKFDLKDWFKLKEADYNGGAGHVWNHHHGRNVSPFFANEDSAYPVAGNQNSSKGRIKIKKIMGRIRLTEEAMEDLVSSEASFRNGMTDEKTRLIDDLAQGKPVARHGRSRRRGTAQRHGDGRGAPGRLARQHCRQLVRQPLLRRRPVLRGRRPGERRASHVDSQGVALERTATA